MSKDLEKRLRAIMEEQAHEPSNDEFMAALREAARIGAEIEREECAALAVRARDEFYKPRDRASRATCDSMAIWIRARGGK